MRGEGGEIRLLRDDAGLALTNGSLLLRCDYLALLPRLRQDRLSRELLVRAARVRGVESPVAVDATAGLGEDAFLLAAAGYRVTMVEREPLLAALVRDGLGRAACESRLRVIVQRMELVEGDSLEVLPALGLSPDVVLLDPMFPARRTNAATKKKLHLIQGLEKPCEDEEALMAAALATHPRKVVVKRPLKGPHLAGVVPSSSLAGKVVRYDVIVPASRREAPPM